MAAIPKQTYRVPKDQRGHNPLKPVFEKKPKSKGLKPVSDKREKRLKANGWDGRSTIYVSRDGEQRLNRTVKVRRSAKPWRNLSARHDWTKTPKARAKLRQVGEMAKRWAKPDAEWRATIWRVWGSCILTGLTRERARETGTVVDAHHCHDKGHNPLEWRWAAWNGLLLRRDIHGMVDNDPDLHTACQVVADECRAAAEGRRPPVSRAEAREAIFRMAPKMRKYTNPEED